MEREATAQHLASGILLMVSAAMPAMRPVDIIPMFMFCSD
jgi:hypothetical protein